MLYIGKGRMEKLRDSERERYWDGHGNRFIRYYFYVNRGLTLLNEARYLILAVFALYAILKLNNPVYMVVMFLVSLPVLGVLGWVFTHRMAKVMDFLNIKFSTHFTKYSIELQEKQNELIGEVVNELRASKSA